MGWRGGLGPRLGATIVVVVPSPQPRDVTPPLPSPCSCTKSGYKGVAHNATSKSHPFVAKTPLATSVSRSHHLGCFATAEEV